MPPENYFMQEPIVNYNVSAVKIYNATVEIRSRVVVAAYLSALLLAVP
jgi:hypothetical protein